MRLFCVYFFAFFSCIGAYAQKNSAIKPGTDTAAITRALLAAHKVLNADSAIVLYNEVLKRSTAANYADGAFLALITRGIKYYEKEDYVEYRNSTIEALPWAEKSTQKDAVAWCYINIGESYLSEGDYIIASEHYYTALKELKKATGDEPNHSAANIYNSLGRVHMRLNQPEKAMGYFNQAEDISRRGKLYYQLAESFIYKGEYYTGIHKPDSATKYFSQVMDIGKQIGKVDLVAIANNNLGKNFIEAGEYQKAIAKLDTAIALAKNRFDYIVVDASYSLGDAFYHLRRYKESEDILTAALKETMAHNYKDNYIKCYSKLVAVYKATGQFKKAMDCMDTLAVLKESLTSTEKAKAINQLEIKYKTAEKDKQIAQNELLIAQQNNKLTRKNIWIASIAGSIFLLAGILLGIYRNARHKQRLQAEQIRVLQQENRIGILNAIVQGEDKERTRIAGELHDGLGGMLSAAMMRFSAIRHENEEITKTPAYREAMNMLNEMGDEIRKTAHNLMPEVLLKQSLPEAVATYCNYMQEAGGLKIDFQCYGPFDNISHAFKLSAYRIVQELVKNINQHARATHALVQLLMQEHVLTITVEDNGVGYDTTRIHKGMGLHNLQTRVRSLDGQLTIESEVNKGTSVYIEFDIQKLTANTPI